MQSKQSQYYITYDDFNDSFLCVIGGETIYKALMPFCDKLYITKVYKDFEADTNDQSNFFLDNSAATSQGGAGIKAAQILVDEHVDVLITPRCGENAASVLLEANIAIYKAAGNNLKDNISACEQGKLEMLNEIHPGLHNHGGK